MAVSSQGTTREMANNECLDEARAAGSAPPLLLNRERMTPVACSRSDIEDGRECSDSFRRIEDESVNSEPPHPSAGKESGFRDRSVYDPLANFRVERPSSFDQLGSRPRCHPSFA